MTVHEEHATPARPDWKAIRAQNEREFKGAEDRVAEAYRVQHAAFVEKQRKEAENTPRKRIGTYGFCSLSFDRAIESRCLTKAGALALFRVGTGSGTSLLGIMNNTFRDSASPLPLSSHPKRLSVNLKAPTCSP